MNQINVIQTGDEPGMLDFHMYPWFERMPAIKLLSDYDILPEPDFSALVKWKGRMESLPCVRNTMLPLEWHMEFLVNLMQKTPTYDIGLDSKELVAKL